MFFTLRLQNLIIDLPQLAHIHSVEVGYHYAAILNLKYYQYFFNISRKINIVLKHLMKDNKSFVYILNFVKLGKKKN